MRTDQVFQDYLSFLEHAQGLSRSCLYLHRRHVGAFLKHLKRQGCTRWMDLSPKHLDRFLHRYARRFRRPYQASVPYTLRRFLKYLHFRGLIERPLEALVLSPRMYRFERLPRFLTDQQLKRLLGSIDRSRPAGRRDYVVIILLASTGLRARELLNLTLDDMDWKERLLHVRSTKTGYGRAVPVPEPAFDALTQYLRRDRPAHAKHRALFMCYGPGGVVPENPRPLSQNTLCRNMRGYLDKLGFKPRSTCHALRHGYAQHLLEQGMGYPALQALLGHRSLQTVGFYARIQFSQLREVTDNYAEKL